MDIKLLNKQKVIEWIKNYRKNIKLCYWMHIELLNKYQVIDWI